MVERLWPRGVSKAKANIDLRLNDHLTYQFCMPCYFAAGLVFHPSKLNSPFTPQSNLSGFSKPTGRSAFGFFSFSASATLTKLLFSTVAP